MTISITIPQGVDPIAYLQGKHDAPQGHTVRFDSDARVLGTSLEYRGKVYTGRGFHPETERILLHSDGTYRVVRQRLRSEGWPEPKPPHQGRTFNPAMALAFATAKNNAPLGSAARKFWDEEIATNLRAISKWAVA